MTDLTTLRIGFKIQVRSIRALIIRDLMVRFGRDNIGFLWVILEPMILCSGVMLIWSAIRSGHEHGIALLTFVMTGYMPLTMWRHMTNTSIYILRRGTASLYHRSVTIIDVILSRVILEFAATTAGAIVIYFTLYMFELVEPIADLGVLIVGWVLMSTLAFSASLLIAAATERTEVAERFIQPMQYLMIPVSGVFFMANWIPTTGRDFLLLNPLMHCFEMVREGVVGTQVHAIYFWWYPAGVSLIGIAVGLHAVESVRDYIQH